MKTIKKVFIYILLAMMIISISQPVTAGSSKININTATKKELTALKYIGDKIAKRMIEYRKTQPFKNPADIMKVKGVGQKTYDANKDIIIVNDKKNNL